MTFIGRRVRVLIGMLAVLVALRGAGAVGAWGSPSVDVQRSSPVPGGPQEDSLGGLVAAEESRRLMGVARACAHSGRLESALKAFRTASQTHSALERASALLQVGHLERRCGRLAVALEQYEQLRLDLRAPPRVRDQAAAWGARVSEGLGRADGVMRAWRNLSLHAMRPSDRARAHLRIVRMSLQEQGLATACHFFIAAERALEGVRREQTEQGHAVRGVLQRLRFDLAEEQVGRLCSLFTPVAFGKRSRFFLHEWVSMLSIGPMHPLCIAVMMWSALLF